MSIKMTKFNEIHNSFWNYIEEVTTEKMHTDEDVQHK